MPCVFADPSAPSRALHVVDADGLAGFLAAQPEGARAWLTGSGFEAGLGDLRVHDLRHTVGMRLREAGVSESTRRDVLWHSNRSVTNHYSMAQIRELHEALEKITQPTNGWNKSLQALKAEHALRKTGTRT